MKTGKIHSSILVRAFGESVYDLLSLNTLQSFGLFISLWSVFQEKNCFTLPFLTRSSNFRSVFPLKEENTLTYREAPLVSMSVFPQKSQNTLRQTGLASRQRASSTRFLYLRSRAFPRDTLWLALPRATDPSGDKLSVP